MDCARLKFITDEIPLLRQVMGKGESAFFDNGGRNFPARTALQSLGAIGLAMSELSNVIQETEPTADWEGMRGLRNYIAHEYLNWNLNLVWEDLHRYTPLLENVVPRLVRWDAEHPVLKPDGEGSP